MVPNWQWDGLSCTIAYNGLTFTDPLIQSIAPGTYASWIDWQPGGAVLGVSLRIGALQDGSGIPKKTSGRQK